MGSTAAEALIEVRGLHKSFPGVHALNDVSFDIGRNTVHCIVGENGAGKSTFIKILTGAMTKSRGEILLGGKPFEPRSVREAMSGGISVLYQELNVVNDLTVAENLTLGKERARLGFIRRGGGMEKVERILRGLDDSISPAMDVGELSVAQKQVIEIAKAVSTDASVLVMDEPTAALSEDEVRRLFDVVRKLRADGMTVIYISHKLSEVFEIGDFVTVFRDGQMVGTRNVAEISRSCRDVPEACLELVKMMLGKVVVEQYVPSRTDRSRKLLEVRGVHNAKLRDVSFDLFKGEILGFYGLVGAGKTEVARVLYGIDPYEGEILVNGAPGGYRSTRGALAAGFSMVPEERRADGIFGALSVKSNIPMMRIASILSNGLISRAKENRLADAYIGRLSVQARDREQKVAFLSGGNQQKVVIAKCLNREGDILLMDEPTRGVDVGAKHEIHEIIRGLANEGKGIIVFSSELPEILHLCDRIVLMHEGTVREVMENGAGADSDRIMAIVAGGKVRA
ncbi:MAG: sugar ABC transporter ATP-binding protein [Spirochaetes bacterium]|nr:sugar ABC transporter ATP-binding protein [Spirochaetota bacterium]